jgi:HNH endonuclease
MAHPTRDHVRPRCRGGTVDGENKAIVCDRCNVDKGAARRWPRGCTYSVRPAIGGPRSLRPLSNERWRGAAAPHLTPMDRQKQNRRSAPIT